MNRVAMLSSEKRNELFMLTAERLGLGSVAVVEKDFWVCWTLKRLFAHPDLSKRRIALRHRRFRPATPAIIMIST